MFHYERKIGRNDLRSFLLTLLRFGDCDRNTKHQRKETERERERERERHLQTKATHYLNVDPTCFFFSAHYDNMPIQYTVIVHDCKNDYFQMKNSDIFFIFAQNIEEYPESKL